MYYLEKVVKRESVIMRKPFVVTDELPTIHVYIQRNMDTMTKEFTKSMENCWKEDQFLRQVMAIVCSMSCLSHYVGAKN